MEKNTFVCYETHVLQRANPVILSGLSDRLISNTCARDVRFDFDNTYSKYFDIKYEMQTNVGIFIICKLGKFHTRVILYYSIP